MRNDLVAEIAINAGFKLKEQEGGEMDLNPYVYEFGHAMYSIGLKAALQSIESYVSKTKSDVNDIFNEDHDNNPQTKLKIEQLIKDNIGT